MNKTLGQQPMRADHSTSKILQEKSALAKQFIPRDSTKNFDVDLNRNFSQIHSNKNSTTSKLKPLSKAGSHSRSSSAFGGNVGAANKLWNLDARKFTPGKSQSNQRDASEKGVDSYISKMYNRR